MFCGIPYADDRLFAARSSQCDSRPHSTSKHTHSRPVHPRSRANSLPNTLFAPDRDARPTDAVRGPGGTVVATGYAASEPTASNTGGADDMSSAVSAIDARVARMVGPFFSGGLGVWGWVWVWGGLVCVGVVG